MSDILALHRTLHDQLAPLQLRSRIDDVCRRVCRCFNKTHPLTRLMMRIAHRDLLWFSILVELEVHLDRHVRPYALDIDYLKCQSVDPSSIGPVPPRAWTPEDHEVAVAVLRDCHAACDILRASPLFLLPDELLFKVRRFETAWRAMDKAFSEL